MRVGRIVRHRLRSLFRRSSAEAEMAREFELHIEQLTKQHLASGMSLSEARLAAHREFGSIEVSKEECRDMRHVNWIEDLAKDVVYAFRLLKKSPGFTLTAVLSLALGIGVNTAIFSVVNAFLIRPLPFRQPERLAVLFERNVMGEEQRVSVAPGNFLDWQKLSTSFEQISAIRTGTVTLTGASPGIDAERVIKCNCSGNLFATLGVSPVAGRTFLPDEDRFEAPRLVVISYGLWQRQFGGLGNAVGQSLRMDSSDYRVIGVMPRGFSYPYRNVDIWVPYLTGSAPHVQIRHDLHFLQVIGRLRAGVPVSQASAELDGIAARYKIAHPAEATGRGAVAVRLHDFLVHDVRTPLMVLLGAVMCVFLIACVNIANLVLTRAAGRAREISVRACLGAGRGRIIRQLVTESVLLALAGGTLGAMLAVSIAGVVAARAPGADAILTDGKLPLDPLLFLFAFGTALIAGIGVGLFPAIRISRTELAESLKAGTRSATATRAQSKLRNILVSVEVALSVVLLIASGLLLRSFVLLHQVQPGVRLDHTLTMEVSLPNTNDRSAAQRAVFLSQLSERLRRLPGVRAAGFTSCPPLTGTCNVVFYYVEGRPFQSGKFLVAADQTVDPAYFGAAGIPLLRGRTFTPQDGVGQDVNHPRTGSIVISETMAKTVFPNEDPIGKRIFFDSEVQNGKIFSRPFPRYEVIGIAGDVLPTIDSKPAPMFYRPLLDVAPRGPTILLHTAVDPKSMVRSARNEIRTLDPALPIYRVQAMDDLVGVSTADRRFTLLLYAAFAGLALLLATIGLYGLVSYAVSQRKSEIGLRMALGATASDVSRLVLRDGLQPAVAGVLLGTAAAVFACRMLRSQLFGVGPADPLTFAIVPLLLLVVAAAACYLPANRASRLDPTLALRAE